MSLGKLQAIYDHEFNVRLEWTWDGGVLAALGDDINGWGECQTFFTVEEAVNWLYERTVGGMDAN